MEREKIILVATSDINYDQRLQKVAQSLHSFGANVLLLGRTVSSSTKLTAKPFQQQRLSCWFNSGVLFYLEFNCRLLLFLLTNKATMVTANDADTLMGVYLASFFKKFTLLYDAHELFTEVPELQGKTFKKGVWAWIEKLGVIKARSCYTVNDSLATILNKKYHKEFLVLRNVPYSQKGIFNTSTEKFILYQGALNKGRGLEIMIRAMVNIDLKLKLAGKGDLLLELQALTKELKLEDKVEFVGNLLPQDLKVLTNKAWLGVNLLEAYSGNYYYSLANKFFDYMHAGVPSITMAFPEYQKINAQFETAILLKDLSEENVVLVVNELLQDEVKYQILQANNMKAKTHFSWEEEELVLKEIYQL